MLRPRLRLGGEAGARHQSVDRMSHSVARLPRLDTAILIPPGQPQTLRGPKPRGPVGPDAASKAGAGGDSGQRRAPGGREPRVVRPQPRLPAPVHAAIIAFGGRRAGARPLILRARVGAGAPTV